MSIKSSAATKWVLLGRWCARVLMLALCISATSVSAQIWTPTGHLGQGFIAVGTPSGGPSISRNYTDLSATHDSFSLSDPGNHSPVSSAFVQVDSVPSPTGMSLAISGNSMRGPIPCPEPDCTDAATAYSYFNDVWSFSLSQSTCFALAIDLNLSDTGTGPPAQSYNFVTNSDIQLSNGQHTTGFSGSMSTPGSLGYYYSGTLSPGTYQMNINGIAGGAGAPYSGSFSHSITVVLGAPRNGDGDGNGVADGRDIAGFVATLMLGGSPGPGICAYDMNGDGVVNDADVALFTALLIGF